jgi:GTPase SAR1 family protein
LFSFKKANKIDLRTDPETIQQMKRSHQQFVKREQGENLAKTIGASGFFECSSKTREGVDEIFVAAVRASLVHSKPSVKKLFSFANNKGSSNSLGSSKNFKRCCPFL